MSEVGGRRLPRFGLRARLFLVALLLSSTFALVVGATSSWQLPVLIASGLVALALSVLLAVVFTALVTRDLRALLRWAQALAPPEAMPGDELPWHSDSVEHLVVELQAAVDVVARERNRFQAALAGMRDAVVALDLDGTVIAHNPAAQSLLGAGRDLVGQKEHELRWASELMVLASRAVRDRVPGTLELRWEEPAEATERERTFWVTATPQRGGGAVVVLRDVSELRRLEAVRRDFVANVSHELRTPVAVIQSSAEALVGGAAGDPVHGPQFAGAVHRHAERLSALISDLLDLARIEAGHHAFSSESVALAPLVSTVLDRLRHRATTRRHDLAMDVPDGLTVLGDAQAMDQILVNLVDNAIKYTPPGGSVSISATRGGARVELTVADTGPGVGLEHRDRIFERFYRVDPGRSREMGGTGLGLAIVRHLVEAQGGTISVAGNSPRGSCFVIRIPHG